MSNKSVQENSNSNKKYFWYFLLFVLAFTIRFAYLNQYQAIPTFNNPVMDEKYHLNLAQKINSPDGLPNEPYFRAPLYPYFLAMCYKITDGSLYWIRFIQIVLASFLPILVMVIGLKLFKKTEAYIASIITAIYPTFIYYDNSLLITSIMVLLTALLILQLYKFQKNLSIRNCLFTGLILGLAGLARPNILLLAPALLIWVWLVLKPKFGFRRAIKHYLLLLCACGIVIIPITIRNYLVADDFVPISWQGGYNFYLGNNRDASGWSASVVGINPSWEGSYNESIAIAEYAMKKRLKHSQVSDFWYDQTLADIKKDPGRFMFLLLKKIRLFVNGYEIPNNQHLYLVRSFVPFIKPVLFDSPLFFPFGIIAPLAILGMAFSLRNWRRYLLLYLLIGSYVISILLFFVCARFRQPLIPFMIIFAVYAVYEIFNYAKFRKYKLLIVSVGAFALLVIESNHFMINLPKNRIEAESQYFIGSAYLTLYKINYEQPDKSLNDPLPDEIVKAMHHFNLAIKADSTFALAFNDMGTIAMRRQKWLEAKQYLKYALKVDPSKFEPYLNYSKLLVRLDQQDSAVKILKDACNKFPYNEQIHYNLALLLWSIGDLELALEAIENCLRLNPSNTEVRRTYGRIQKQLEVQTSVVD